MGHLDWIQRPTSKYCQSSHVRLENKATVRRLAYRSAYSHVARKVRARSPAVPNICVRLRNHTFVDISAVCPVEALLVKLTRQAEVSSVAALVEVHREIHKRSVYDAPVCVNGTTAESRDRVEDGGLVQRAALCVGHLVPVWLGASIAALSLQIHFMHAHYSSVYQLSLNGIEWHEEALLYSLCHGRKGPLLCMTFAWTMCVYIKSSQRF